MSVFCVNYILIKKFPGFWEDWEGDEVMGFVADSLSYNYSKWFHQGLQFHCFGKDTTCVPKNNLMRILTVVIRFDKKKIPFKISKVKKNAKINCRWGSGLLIVWWLLLFICELPTKHVWTSIFHYGSWWCPSHSSRTSVKAHQRMLLRAGLMKQHSDSDLDRMRAATQHIWA